MRVTRCILLICDAAAEMFWWMYEEQSSYNYMTEKKKAEQFMPLFLRGHQLHGCYLDEF